MKRIVVLHRYPPKQVIATNPSFLAFLRKLISKGHEVFYITYREKGERYIDKHIPGLNFIYLPFTFDRGNYFDKILKTCMWLIIAPLYVLYLRLKYGLDLVYCDDSVPYYGFLLKLLSPFPKVVIRMGDLHIGYALADNHPTIFKLMLSIELLMWKALDGFIPISISFKDFIIRLGISESKIKVVEESINLDDKFFDNNYYDTGVESKKIVFFFHGALVSCKGVDVLIEAFKKFSENKDNVHLVIAGGGPEEENLKTLSKKLSVKNIEFKGWYKHEELKNIIKDVDVGVVMRSPNLANNFVVTTCLLENWKYRLPVIVPNLTSFKNIIKDGENGVIFKAGDITDLSRKMEYLYENKHLWRVLGTNGYSTAKSHFYYKNIASKMVQSLEDFL